MDSVVCLDENFSTTRLLTKDKPVIENHPKDKVHSILFLPENPERKGEGGLRTKGYFKKSYEDKPLITVVTVVYNGEKHLEQTIRSVIDQDYENVEYIIIDGGSTDGTLDIVRKYEGQIDYWVSEKDSGIYDAMNKGMVLSAGDIVGCIHADDYYEHNVLQEIITVYTGTKANVVYGDMVYDNSGTRRIIPAHNTGKRYNIFPYNLNWIWVKMLFGHPSSFVSQKTYKKYGLYDARFKIAADYDFFIKLKRKKVHFYYSPQVIAHFREGGISTTELKQVQRENFLVRKKNNLLLAYLVEFGLYILNQLKNKKV